MSPGKLQRLAGREGARALLDGFRDNRLLTYASAISFRILFALVPFTLFVLALLGFLHLDELWAREVAPAVRRGVSPAIYQLIDDAVRRVLTERELFWLTAGALIALWLMSGAVRAAMEALDGIYAARRERPTLERMRRSLWLATAVGACFVAAAAVVRLGPLLLQRGSDDALLTVFSFVVRWGLAVALLGLAAFLIVRHGPAAPQPVGWVSFGSTLAVACWVLTSVAFGAYLTSVPFYSSVYGSLSGVVVLFTYVYLSAAAFLFGAQVDALLRYEAEGDPTGQADRASAAGGAERRRATPRPGG